MSEWNPDFFISRAATYGASVAQFVAKLMESKAHPEQGYKACQGVLNLAAHVGADRIQRACLRAQKHQNYSYWVIEDILTKKLDELNPESETLADEQQTPSHVNIRGNKYYQ